MSTMTVTFHQIQDLPEYDITPVPKNIVKFSTFEKVVHDARSIGFEEFTFDKHGFQIVTHHSKANLSPHDDESIEKYKREMEQLVLEAFGADVAFCYDVKVNIPMHKSGV